MKKYEELTPTEQESAVNLCTNNILEAICEGALRFNDAANDDNLQARIEIARGKADAMQTPWFASSYIMDTCAEEIRGMAQVEAEEAMYAEPSEHIISGILGRRATEREEHT